MKQLVAARAKVEELTMLAKSQARTAAEKQQALDLSLKLKTE